MGAFIPSLAVAQDSGVEAVRRWRYDRAALVWATAGGPITGGGWKRSDDPDYRMVACEQHQPTPLWSSHGTPLSLALAGRFVVSCQHTV